MHMFEMLAMTWTCLVFRKDKLPPPFGLDVLGSVSAKTSSSLSCSGKATPPARSSGSGESTLAAVPIACYFCTV